MNTKNNYTALTIGPIIKTLQSVKSTKAIWAASYMFSYLMKEMIKKIKEENSGIRFLIPHTNEVKINGKTLNPLNGNSHAGLFPDRFITEGKVDDLNNTIKKILEKFAKDVFDDLNKIKKDEEKPKVIDENLIIKFLENYINFYHLNIELEDNKNVIDEIYKLLDSLELQQRVIEKADIDYLHYFFEKCYYNILIRNQFEKNEIKFPSTIQIATAEFSINNEYKAVENILKDKDDEKSQTNFIKRIKEIAGDQYRNYQKYIAVVQADGDNIGVFNKFLYDQPDKENLIKLFSQNILSFSIEAVKLVNGFRGTPIYAGGDDLLFFAPVAHSHFDTDNKRVNIEKTIINLINEIDKKFDFYFKDDPVLAKVINDQDAVKKFEEKGEKFRKPSMSYGVSISYYKYPLTQALEQGAKQLFDKAKAGNKNAVSFTILKHSGHYFGTTFHKKSASYSKFSELITTPFEKEEFIKSIIRKLDPQKYVFMAIGERGKDYRNKMIDSFFINNFNESIHKDKTDKSKLVPFLENTKQLVKEVYEEEKVEGSKEEKAKINDNNIMKIYSALRFIEFIHNKEERDE